MPVSTVTKFDLLQGKLVGELKSSIPLAQFTSFRLGGPAALLYVASTPERLVRAYILANELKIRYFVLGGGSNIVFADDGFDGLVIKDECDRFEINGTTIAVQSGVSYDRLVDIAIENSLAGLEFAAGIPGTVGGAIWGNAGAWGKSIGDILEQAVVVSPEGKIMIVGPEFFQFNYRHSRLKTDPHLVVSARLKLRPGDKTTLAKEAAEIRRIRQSKHPTWEGSAGSVFKNIKSPEVIPAGKLLEEAGVKGMKVGGAEVYEKHCNIIVNKGQATASDVRKLAELMKAKALEKHGLSLEYEITFIEP